MDEKNVIRARVWAFIVYVTSAPEDWLDKLMALHVPLAVSPLHAADDTDTKPHYHVLLRYDGKKSYSQVRRVVAELHGAGPVSVQSVGGYARYLCHLDETDKPTYDPREVICMSGFDYSEYIKPSGTALREVVRNIDQFILDHDIREVCDLLEYALEEEPEWYDVLQSPSQLSRVSRLIASTRHADPYTRWKKRLLKSSAYCGTLEEVE